MKYLLLALLLFCNALYAQVPQPKQLNTRSNYNLTDTVRNYDIREKLVQLAMNNPQYEVADRSATIAEYQVRIAKGSWLALIGAQGNINEFTINPKSAGTTTVGTGANTTTIANPIYYPKYNFGITIPFDIVTRTSNNIKIAKETYLIAQANKNDKYRTIRAEVLTKYEDYLLAKDKLELQLQITQDAYTTYQIAQRDVKQNLIKTEDYSKAYRNWVTEQISKLDLQRNYNVTKIELEKIIGVRLDDILHD